jgi:hypothetical protein
MRSYRWLLLVCAALSAPAAVVAQAPAVFSEADHLRGGYGPFRANNDLLYYHLDVRVDPDKQTLRGKNSIRFKMLKDGTRIQLDLVPTFQIDKILLDRPQDAPLVLRFERAAGRTVYVDFPQKLLRGGIYTVEFYYSGHPVEMGRFGGFVFRKDPMGRPLVNTACEEDGASVWWPNKDQWRDEVASMDISVEAPSDLVEVSGGRFQGKEELPDGYTRWNWHVNYPINNYDVSLNIGKYVHFADRYGELTLDYMCLQLRPIFDEYLRHAAIPTLELRFDEEPHTVSYRWRAEERQFAMPVRAGLKNDWQIIRPTTQWQRMRTGIAKDDFAVATDLYYINVSKGTKHGNL